MSLNRLKRDLSITVAIELLAKIPLYGFEFLLASWLLLDQYAEWVALALIYRFAPYAHLGALSYFNKRYPILLGAGQEEAARKLKEHTNRVVNLLIFFCFIVALTLYLLSYLSTTAFLVIGGVLMMQVFTYCQATVRNEGNFLAYSTGLVIFSILQFSIAYITVKHYGLMAGILSTFVAYFAAVIYYLLLTKTNYRFFVPKVRNFNRILKLGWAPFLLTISSFLTQTSDRIALMFVFDESKLAFYGFFSIFFQMGIVAINSLGKVLSPYILHLSGKRNLSNTISVSIYTCYVMLLIYIGMNIVLLSKGEWLIHQYFLKFSGGWLGVYNYGTMGILLAFTISFYPQLLAANKELFIIKINIIYFIISVITVFILAKYGPGFYSYSVGSLILNMIYTGTFLFIIENVIGTKIFMVRFCFLFICLLTLIVNIFY